MRDPTNPFQDRGEVQRALKAATLTLSQRPEEVRAAQDRMREYAFDLLQPFVNAGKETTPEIHQLSCDIFTLINAASELALLHAAPTAAP